MSIPRLIRRRVRNLVPIGPAVWQLPRLLNLWPPKSPRNAPWGNEGRLVFSLCPFPDESADVNQSWPMPIGPAVWQLPQTLNVWPHKPPPPSAPLRLEGQFVWRISIPRWICTYVPNLVPISPAVWQLPNIFWICDPINPPPPPKCPWGIEGRIVFSRCPFPDESADVYQIWCQSVQPFDSFPRF